MQFPQIERRAGLSDHAFIRDHLRQRRPVVVTDAMRDWAALGKWTPGYLKGLLGDMTVCLQGGGFQETRRMRFADYVDLLPRFESGDVPAGQEVPYLRWSDEDGGFTDALFRCVREDWARPSFLPARFYLHPHVLHSDPTTLRHPASGIYVSPKGAVTKLHADSGLTNAVLCQVHGRKQCFLISPDQAPLFPDLKSRTPEPWDSPRLREAYAGARVVETVLEPGDILFIPGCWLHEVYTLSASVSLTYNFAHVTEAARYMPFAVHYVASEAARQLSPPVLRRPVLRLLDGYARLGRRLNLEGF
ncbi:cupin-like domain-containing protein [Corallococcus aberystwythensis]|uniref:JmjC domain-containing protein n=1 Tax=Corallococcus aberystwythensis TaxID=2316722 RepID=A0A3A8PVI0_9BACT|nr:cupin-like domain-containing protein [Corallococcus aberystwythensis]RKH60319.1 hypothetical protein D7W81_25760 [Corallococcus aberystwythensis]